MGRIGSQHRELTNGVGKCSVPMWRWGVPDGFCDRPAYGPHVDQDRYGGYVPALACWRHGGPKPVAVESEAEA